VCRSHIPCTTEWDYGSYSSVSSPITIRFPAIRPLAEALDGIGPVVDSPTDEALMGRIIDGNQDALGCLFQRYVGLIQGIATRILRDAAEAEDLVQEFFLFIQRHCSIFDSSKSSARSWLVHMAYQRAIDRRRYLATRQFYAAAGIDGRAERLVGNPTAEQDYSPEAVFGRNGLTKVLEALSEDQRETLRLHFFEGYTLAEVGTKLGQPIGNVRHHYYRALQKLRKQIFGRNVRES
jgi:RNA polymerase sigma-70 factor, ECF subfamily